MAWDATRPVPWKRLTNEWLVYAAIMTAVFLAFFRASVSWGSLVGLLVSYPMYVGIGAALAKLGYQRASLKQLRAQPTRSATTSPAAASKRPPAPTKRTSTGPTQHPRRTRATRKR
jgi:hypothetical protein